MYTLSLSITNRLGINIFMKLYMPLAVLYIVYIHLEVVFV